MTSNRRPRLGVRDYLWAGSGVGLVYLTVIMMNALGQFEIASPVATIAVIALTVFTFEGVLEYRRRLRKKQPHES
ncbi:hypothetical protein GCM10027062_11170 [Nocardioides hungaricus]